MDGLGGWRSTPSRGVPERFFQPVPEPVPEGAITGFAGTGTGNTSFARGDKNRAKSSR